MAASSSSAPSNSIQEEVHLTVTDLQPSLNGCSNNAILESLSLSSSPSFFELTTSLELLSCIQTDQIIPIRKISDAVIPALLNNLSKGKQRSNDNDLSPPMHVLLEKIQRDLSDLKGTLERLKEWEDNLNSLPRRLMLYNWEDAFSSELVSSSLTDIDKMVLELKSHTSSLWPLETFTSKSSNSPPSQISVPKLSARFSETAFVDFQARYDRLDFPQKQSLLYFSIFPENSIIRKKAVIYLLIGEEIVDDEEVADRLFAELAAKGFIEPVDEKDTGDFNGCKINPLIRSALITLSQSANLFDFDSEGNPTANFTGSRRACLVKTEEGSLQRLFTHGNPDKLLTLFNVSESCLDFPKNWLSNLSNITVLHLGNWSCTSVTEEYNYIEAEEWGGSFLRCLRNARLMRCLSLNEISGVTFLPSSICKLGSLRILDLKSCWNLERLPYEIASLENLTRLDMSECYSIESMPKGIASLSNLQVLKGFIIGGGGSSSKRTDGQCTLDDLVKLERLRKLGLYADRETTGENGELNCLSRLLGLRALTVQWTTPRCLNVSQQVGNLRSSCSVTSSQISLPASLEKLDLRCWPLSEMPGWMKPWELSSLKKLYIRGGKLSDMKIQKPQPQQQQQQVHCDPPKWCSVKILRLKFLKELEITWPALTTMFPKVIFLEKEDCPKLCFPSGKVWRRGESCD